MKHKIICGHVLDVLKRLPDESVDTIITSPPYWKMRSYLPDNHPSKDKEIGQESTLDEYISHLLEVTQELKRVLKRTGIMFWNHDTKKQNLCDTMQNYRLIIRMIDEQGWLMPNKGPIIWFKPNHQPDSFKRGFAHSYEPIFILVKNRNYWFDLDAIRVPYKTTIEEYKAKLPKSPENKTIFEGGPGHLKYSTPEVIERRFALGKNPGDVWRIATEPFHDAHFAIFPTKLVEPMIKAGCPQWICKECGKARVRIVRPTGRYITQGGYGSRTADLIGASPTSSLRTKKVQEKQTIGWTDCGCNAGWEAGVVLDPFAGSGTVGVVAERLGRNSILIDLNKEYCEMALKRLKPLVAQKKLTGEESIIETEGF